MRAEENLSSHQPGLGPLDEDFNSVYPLSGLAKLAAMSPLQALRNNVHYFSLPARSVLNRCSNPAMPFEWTINPYRGCEFGCKYCYARYTHEFMELRHPDDFEKKIYAKESAAELIRAELKTDKIRGAEIAIGTATDPYQPAEREFKVTRQVLEQIAPLRSIRLSITTKSDLVLRDVELLQQVSKRNQLRVNLSITTADARLARLLEPRAPRPERRFKAIRQMVDNGIKAGVLMMPLLPGITTRDGNLEAVIRLAAQAKAQFLHAGVLFLMPSAQSLFLPFLKQHFPPLAGKYERQFARSPFLPETYKQQVMEKVHRLREQFGIPNDDQSSCGEELGDSDHHAQMHFEFLREDPSRVET